MASEKRCHYEVLGLRRECTADEIRSAYKKLALQRHPDKLIQAGVPEAEATASFQELLNAYETLSDPKERGWYDSHRSKILFSSPDSSNSTVPNLFSYFSNSAFSGFSDTGRGFYAVYRDVFNKIYSSEVNFVKKLGLRSGIVKEAPLMGNLESPYSQVQAFYNYWLGFCTVMDFCWVDQYDVMSGTNRKSRRVMEEDNGKLRKKAKKEYNETVRGLASFVKRRDKRVIDMQVKKSREMERKKEEEMRKRKEIERERLERAKAYKEPEWATIEEVDFEEEGMEDVEEQKKDIKELYCMVCGKKFKSEKQWKNHEQSKKHREKVAELKGALKDDFQEYEVEEKFRNNFSVRGEKDDDSTHESGKDGNEDDEDFVGNGDDIEGVIESVNSDDETSVLKAMLSGQKNKENATSFQVPEATSMGDEANIDGEEVGFMAYDNRKGNRRKMKGKRNKGKTVELREVDINETSGQDGQNNELDNLEIGNCFSNDLEGKDNSLRASDQPIDRKGYVKNGEHVKPRNVSKKNSYKVQAVQKYLSSSPPQDAECLSLVLRRAYRPELGRVSYNFCPEVVVLLVCVTMFCIYASYDGGLGFFFQI